MSLGAGGRSRTATDKDPKLGPSFSIDVNSSQDSVFPFPHGIPRKKAWKSRRRIHLIVPRHILSLKHINTLNELAGEGC